MTGKRKRYTAEFKARVALRGELTAAQLATKHGVHQAMIAAWKKQAVEGLAAALPLLPPGDRCAMAFGVLGPGGRPGDGEVGRGRG
jgi:transposase-like protein